MLGKLPCWVRLPMSLGSRKPLLNNGRQLLLGNGKVATTVGKMRKPGDGKPPTILPGALEMCCPEGCQARRMPGMGGLQRGGIPGGWHQ